MSEPAFRPAGTTALPPQTSRMRQEAGQLRMPACLCYSGLFRPCLAMPCLPASALTPCLLALVFVFAPVSIHYHVRQDHRASCGDCPAGSPADHCVCLPQCPSSVLQGLPCRQPHTGTALVQPVHRLCSLLNCAHFKGEAWDCIGPPATFCVHTCICFMSQRLHLGSLAPCFKNGLWDGIGHAGMG